jgi:uncharacterized protein with beta-barrel porin domain
MALLKTIVISRTPRGISREALKASSALSSLTLLVPLALTWTLASTQAALADCVRSGNRVTCSGTSTAVDAPLARAVSGETVTNTGEASVSGTASSGFLGTGNGVTLTNDGRLTTSGNSVDALEALGHDNIIVNNGFVSTQGNSADALRAIGDRNQLTNTGEVRTTVGSSARGMVAEGAGNTLTNRGSIITTGSGAEGMNGDGNNNTVVNHGQISTSGAVANGIRARGNQNTILNTGTVKTTGLEARGIKVDGGTGTTIVNRGTVTTEGQAAYGVWAASQTGQTARLVNEAGGVIESRQEQTLHFDSGNETVENFGRLTNFSGGAAADLGAGDDSFLIGSTSQIDGFVDASAGTDTFALGGATDASFDVSKIGSGAQYRNFENYEKVGSSTWTTTGTNNAAMPWAIREGALMVVGSMGGSNMTVFSGATLGGNGTVGSISARSGSTLTPGVGGIGVLTSNGNVLIANGVNYRVDLNPGLQSDRIVAKGSATVEGGTVQVSAVPGDYRPGSRWTILTADGGVTGQFINATTNLALFKPVLTKDGNNIYLSLPITTENMPADRPIIEPYFPVTTEELPRVLDLTSGEANVSATGVILAHEDLFRAAVLCRMRCSMGGLPTFTALDGVTMEYAADLPTRKAPAPAVVLPQQSRADWAIWGKAIGSWGSTDATATTAAIDRTTGGLVFGADTGFGTPYRFGIAAGYFSSGFSAASLSSMGTVESVYVGAYGAASFGAFNLRGGVSYGHHEVDMHRNIVFTGFSGTTASGSSTESFQAFGELGYAFALNPNVTLEPFVGLAHVHIGSRGIVEEGSAVAVMGEAHSFDTTYSTLGARIIATMPTSAGLLTFKGLLGRRHAFGDTVPEATFSYVSGSTPFLISGAPIDTDSLIAEAGLNWAVSEKVTLGVVYTGAIGERNREHTLRGSLSVRF